MGVEDSPRGKLLRYMAPLKVLRSRAAWCATRSRATSWATSAADSAFPCWVLIEAMTRDGIRQTTPCIARPSRWCWRSAGACSNCCAVAGELVVKIGELEEAHVQLLQSEKMASIGVLCCRRGPRDQQSDRFREFEPGTPKDYHKTMVALLDACRAGRATRRISL